MKGKIIYITFFYQLLFYEVYSKQNTKFEHETFTSAARILSLQRTILNLALLLIVLGGLFYWYREKSLRLQKEKSEALERMDALKKRVIKNHIVLKDKTKLYLSDLVYIKADGHYLNIFISNNKKHFVRYKLSKIMEDLPPNFIQCHKSYIVNLNYIKRINSKTVFLNNNRTVPLSRSFKNDFFI
ncbi:hypothetical protein GWK08_08955 [Leptobacterium flavescens]|uniref:HTH LytTR-type domain-containing protein n=1 Tax=Leptobacterium flavescens TaxID=472055 RepID=A0A6P0URS0_9FLAO|nr:LytTR family DNA-binding domain-containing protein [Leptobacterium flavescens]NER13563.1 hypothetical protein [Leptobacterium flavescens]